MNGRNSVNNLEVYIDNTDETDDLVDRLEAYLDNTFNNADNAYSLINMESLMKMMDTMYDMMTKLLAGIASISLMVGGIGIMNMMLTNVTERIREIGIRRAIGAQRASIVTQFLIEAGMLCGMGGVVGIAVGTVGSVVVSRLMYQMTVYPPVWVGLAAFALSVALGVLFGSYPAIKASKLQPVEALRAE